MSETGTVDDFKAEVLQLAELLNGLNESDWIAPTLFKNWSIEDVILHLYASDHAAITSVISTDDYNRLRADILRMRASGLSMIEEARTQFPDTHGRRLLSAWKEQALELCHLVAARNNSARLRWAEATMSVQSFMTARQMETWAHGQEIYDSLGRERVEHDRIKNIAELGVRTFGWSFSNRGLPIPPTTPIVKLSLPSGRIWQAAGAKGPNTISGAAIEFCQVVTQVRNILDTHLSIEGGSARAWMEIAQCFAGPPHDPPPRGTRYRAGSARGGQGETFAS